MKLIPIDISFFFFSLQLHPQKKEICIEDIETKIEREKVRRTAKREQRKGKTRRVEKQKKIEEIYYHLLFLIFF